MEKRLLIALFLSTLVLVVWNFATPRRPAPEVRAPAAQTAPAVTPRESPVENAVAQPVVGELEVVPELPDLTLSVGEPGQPGSYLARFSNRGARLVELRLGDSYDHARLSEEEQRSTDHWTRLIESADATGGPTGSLVLRSDASARALEREPLDRANWTMRELSASEGGPGVLFTLTPGTGVRFAKRVTFEPGTYRLHVELALENLALDSIAHAQFVFTPAEVVPAESGDRFYYEPQAIAAGRSAEDALEPALHPPDAESVAREFKPKSTGGAFAIHQEVLSFAGVHNKYFAVLLRPADAVAQKSLTNASWRRVRDEAYARAHPAEAAEAWRHVATDVRLDLALPAKGETARWSYVLYAGPKSRSALVGDFADHESVLERDLSSVIPLAESTSRVLLVVLGAIESVTGNWGVAIILLTFAVRLVLFPINRRSQVQMARFAKKTKRLQPKIEELKKQFANDPDKLRKAQAELMQKEGMVPPLGGCLPLFLQFPVFIGLFTALRTAFELRQAPFVGWMIDLSQPDRLLELGWNTHLPLIGTISHLNLLPLLMVVLSLIQQKTLPKPLDEQAARMQKMMMFFPVVMCLLFYDYAAGLSLYMITQSVLGIFEQTVIKKVWPIDDSEPEKKPRSGFLARLQQRALEKQREQEERRRRLASAGRGKAKRR